MSSATTSPQKSRFAFAHKENAEPHNNENSSAAANAIPISPANSAVKRTGVISRLVGANPSPKYGFIQTTDGENIFFHWKGLSVEAMACIECGTEVEFDVCPNPYSENRPMASNLTVKGSTNKYQNATGTLTRWFADKQFGFIETCDGATHFAHKSAFMTESSLVSDVAMLEEGMQVVFDKSVNYKSSPPKPFALNVKVTAMPPPVRPTLNTTIAGRPALRPWTPSARTLNKLSSGGGELCSTSSATSPRRSWRASSASSENGSRSWRCSAGSSSSPKSTLFQGYKVPNACKNSASPPPGFTSNDRSSASSATWRRAAPAC